MILSCNSCEKKFVVPDSAISTSGRLVQCSSCGNKWKQFPVKQVAETTQDIKKTIIAKPSPKKTKIPTKPKNKKKSKKTGPDLYSPEYLAKKHGLKINSESPTKKQKAVENNITFGFYASILVFVIFLVTILRLIFFAEDIIIEKLPNSEPYLNYLFESLRNIKDIILNLLY